MIIIAIIVIAGMALGSLLIKRLTYNAESLKQHWIAFKKNIESGGSLEDYNELDTNQLLYYLITLGLGNNELKNIDYQEGIRQLEVKFEKNMDNATFQEIIDLKSKAKSN